MRTCVCVCAREKTRTIDCLCCEKHVREIVCAPQCYVQYVRLSVYCVKWLHGRAEIEIPCISKYRNLLCACCMVLCVFSGCNRSFNGSFTMNRFL